MKNNHKETTPQRYSDQVEYYLNHLEKQKKAMKNKYSILGQHHNHLDSFVRNSVSKLKSGSKILDAGCGLSAWTNTRLRNKYKISGIDGEPDSIAACKILYPNQNYTVGNLYKLDAREDAFDCVVMREVIEHFITPEIAVKEVNRILKKNGLFILTTPNYDSKLVFLIENTYNRFFGGACKPYKDDVHPSKFNSRTLAITLSKYFEIEKLGTIDYGISQICVARKR